MTKRRICHLCNLGMNGKAVFLCNVLEHTDYSKYDVTILNYRQDSAPAVLERLEKLPVRIVNPANRSMKSYVKLLRKEFTENRFDIVHSHIWDLSGIYLYIARMNGVPIRVAHSHNTSKAPGRYNPIKTFARDRIIWPFLQFMIEKNANRYLACSENAAKWLFTHRILAQKREQVITNGIDMNVFHPVDIAKDKSRIHILFAGRMVYQKNPLYALDVFEKCIHYARTVVGTPSVHLTMVGTGVMDEEIDRSICERNLSDYVTRVSQTGDMAQYYRMADVFLLPSHYEGLGIVLVEAQACGTKCLTSSAVPLDVQCGLVRYLDLKEGASAWARELLNLLEDKSMQVDLGKLYQFSIENTIRQLDIAYSTEEQL